MRRSTVFWAAVLIVVGAVLLLGNMGFWSSIGVNAWDLLWPLLLIGLGGWLLWGIVAGPRGLDEEEVVIPLEGAQQARVRINHGAGVLRVDGSAGPDELVTGTFAGGLRHRSRREGDWLDVTMRVAGRGAWPIITPWSWARGAGFGWSFGLNRQIPLSLAFETGASDARLDLTDLRVTDLLLKTGASSTVLRLPANAGNTRVRIESGAASVSVQVPPGVAGRIRVKAGLAGITVDRGRFPRLGDVYQSADYDTAPNRVDIDVEAGVGAVHIR